MSASRSSAIERDLDLFVEDAIAHQIFAMFLPGEFPMNEEEKLFALMAIAEEQQAAAKNAIDGLIAQQKNFAEQRTEIATIISEMARAAALANGAIEQAAGAAIGSLATPSVQSAADPAAEAFKRAVERAMADLSGIVVNAVGLDRQRRASLVNLSWRWVVLAASVAGGVLIAIWFASLVSISWQRHQIEKLIAERGKLEEEIVQLQVQSNNLAKRGGRVRLEMCGTNRRLCVQVLRNEIYGEQGDYFVVKGY
jgi:hypothetical protein